jgi:hypothetical protein
MVFTDDYPFSTTLEDQPYRDIFGFIIKPQVAHACVCNESNVVILNIEPYSILGKLIEEQLGDKNAVVFYAKTEFQHFLGIQEDDFSLDSLLDYGSQNSLIQPLDTRIEDPSHLFMSILKWKTSRLRMLLIMFSCPLLD